MGYIHLEIEWNSWLGGYRPQIPIFSALHPQLNLLNPPIKNCWCKLPFPTEIFSRYATACSCVLTMLKTIKGDSDCEIRSIIRCLNPRSVLPSEIHHQICQVCCDSAVSAGMVRKCVWVFNGRRENVHDDARSGRPIWWVMFWCVSSTKECVMTDVS
jgi:hypothetical protein